MGKVFLTTALVGALWSSIGLAQTAPAAPTPATTTPATTAAPARTAARPMPPLPRGDGPANALNKFVLKEMTQCRTLAAAPERRACCEKVLHPNACAE
ncbi:MAG: hypothetical protein K0S54_3255 [Alphaproteobacteria bacterium]|jgi:hypothetical protein|nr:hypothetical protein [Alphaproteobacteria bacterium]